jgi:hypothetical protein
LRIPNFRIPLFRWTWSRRIPAMFRQSVHGKPDVHAAVNNTKAVNVTIIQAPYTPLRDAMERKDWQDEDTQ